MVWGRGRDYGGGNMGKVGEMIEEAEMEMGKGESGRSPIEIFGKMC
jgi:hypothetical protein